MEGVTIITNDQESLIKFRYNQDILDILKEFKNRKYIKDKRGFSLPNTDIDIFKNRLKLNNIIWKESKDLQSRYLIEEINVTISPESFHVKLPIYNKDFYYKIKNNKQIIENNLMKFDISYLSQFLIHCEEFNIEPITKQTEQVLKEISNIIS